MYTQEPRLYIHQVHDVDISTLEASLEMHAYPTSRYMNYNIHVSIAKHGMFYGLFTLPV